MSVLSKPYFHDEAAAFAFVEGIIWNGAPHCPTCGSVKIYAIKPNPEKKVRMGLKKCGDCKRQFTVRIGTIFEESHLPLSKWLQAIYLMCSSKKGISAKQLERTLECTYKTAWFTAHRIRNENPDADRPRQWPRPLERIDWRSLKGGHSNATRKGLPESVSGKRVSATHLHAFELNYLQVEGRMRAHDLPYASEIEEDLDSFESLRKYAGIRFRINNITVVTPPPWEYKLFSGDRG